jgi:hypothetical protein
MIRANINLTADDLVDMLMYEPKDQVTLTQLERLIKMKHPGNYDFVEFVDPDVVNGDSVLLVTVDFHTEGDRILFVMGWDTHGR